MIEVRTFALALEEREDGRTLTGLAVPYDSPTKIANYTETFKRGAFADADPDQVPLLAQHDREQLPIGRATSLTERTDGLEVELRVSKTALGDDVLALVHDGAVTGISVGFIPVEDRWDAQRTSVERVKAKLVELSLTAFPAYDESRILAVREELVTTVTNPRPRLQVALRRR